MSYDFTVGIKLEDIFVKQPSHLLASKDDSSLCARQKRDITLLLREHIHINTVKVAKHSHIIWPKGRHRIKDLVASGLILRCRD